MMQNNAQFNYMRFLIMVGEKEEKNQAINDIHYTH